MTGEVTEVCRLIFSAQLLLLISWILYYIVVDNHEKLRPRDQILEDSFRYLA
jgi:hypothetical protein